MFWGIDNKDACYKRVIGYQSYQFYVTSSRDVLAFERERSKDDRRVLPFAFSHKIIQMKIWVL